MLPPSPRFALPSPDRSCRKRFLSALWLPPRHADPCCPPAAIDRRQSSASARAHTDRKIDHAALPPARGRRRRGVAPLRPAQTHRDIHRGQVLSGLDCPRTHPPPPHTSPSSHRLIH